MIYAQILAGGKGTRMGNVPMPKQFLTLADKPILIHTIEKFTLESRFAAILVVCPADWLSHTQDLVDRYITDQRVRVITGGPERNETLMKGIAYIREHFGQHADDVVVTHDAVRPFITERIIFDNIAAVLKHPVVDTVMPAVDTIVQGQADTIDEIPVRSTMYQGQTPQSFNIDTLVSSYESLTTEQKATLSDSCKICLLAGQPVTMVRGESLNFKITTPYDLRVALSRKEGLTMLSQVYRLVSARRFEVQTVAETVGPDELVLRPRYLSVCHADQRYFTGQRPRKILHQKLPMALIHEGVGEVVHDPKGEFKSGTPMVIIPDTPAENDPIIKENYLPTSKFRSSGYDGCMQEYVVLPRDRALEIPTDFDPKMAAFIEMVSVGTHALTQLEATMDADQRVIGVWGDGNLGYITATLVKQLFPDSELVIFGRHQSKLDYFSFADKTFVVDAVPADLKVSQAIECTGGRGSEQAIQQIIDHIQPMGTAILMGVSEDPVDIDTRAVLAEGLTLRGVSRSGRADFERAVAILKTSPVTRERLQNLIGLTRKVTTIQEMTDFFESDLTNYWGKAVMEWDV